MNTQVMPKEELLNIAKSTSSLDILNILTLNMDANIRRAVARNKNSSPELLEKLAYDPVENVSYMAVNNPNCFVKRDFTQSSPCVSCEKDERTLECTKCEILENYYCSLNRK